MMQQNSQPDLSEYITQTTQGLNLQQFLRFNTSAPVKVCNSFTNIQSNASDLSLISRC